MKNEKFCFSKGTGLIALVGVLLVAFVLLAQLANTQTSTNSKAAPPAVQFIPTGDRKITCPETGTVQVWKQGSAYYKDSGVCAACAELDKSKALKACQKCCNEPATEAEYLALHPNPSAWDCMKDDTSTGRKAGYYQLSGNGAACTGVGTKLVNGGTSNQRCDNELNAPLSKCTAPTAIDCMKDDTSTGRKAGYYMLSGNGKVCTGVGTKAFKSGAPDQYCGNEASVDLSKCASVKPAAWDCMKDDTSTGRKAGYYTFNGNNTVCTGVGTKLFNGGTASQYCGNEASVDLSKCTAPATITCPAVTPKVYKDGGDGCYLINGKVMLGGTANQYCANLKMSSWTCCGDANATGCQ